MRFVALDVETANARMRSICQIGLVVFEDGREIHAESQLVDPREEFDFMNIAVHGIEADHVAGRPIFPDLHEWLIRQTDGATIVAHTHFDQTSISQALQHHSLPSLGSPWLDTSKVARRAWERFSSSGYGLANLAREFGIVFKHHDALEDARTCGYILQRAMDDTGLSIDEWIARCKLGLSGNPKGRETRTGDGDGPLLGETIVFTGALVVPRREAADLAHVAGARVEGGVTKETTMLVVGDQDVDRLAGADKSSKHRKAEQMAAKGHPIRILTESDFLAFVAADNAELQTSAKQPASGSRSHAPSPPKPHQARSPDEIEAKIQTLLAWADKTELEAKQKGWGVAPAPYMDLAIIYRKLKRIDDEIAILQRFQRQKRSPGVVPAQIDERLAKALVLKG